MVRSPPDKALVASVAPPSTKLTEPVAGRKLVNVTVAVNVTGVPASGELAEATSVVVVGPGLTVTTAVFEAAPLLFASP
jgi:hypothetical protein